MKIEEIKPEELEKLEDTEILSLHYRAHQLWGKNFAGKNDKEKEGEEK